MQYSDFEDHIHALILERGKEYFDKNAVKKLERKKDGWASVVQGQEEYNVLLKGKDSLDEWYCNCPHDHGPVCKHVAATLYAIRDKLDHDFSALLDKMSREQIEDIIKTRMLESEDFAKWVEKNYKDPA